MNGFRILQSHNGQGWETVGTIKKVEKGIVAGVYNLFLSKEAEANNTVYEGIILCFIPGLFPQRIHRILPVI
jgi:hypothetical protein